MNWNLLTYSAVVSNCRLWFSNNSFNGLFYMDIKTKDIKLASIFPEERIDRKLMHKKCLTYGDKLIFIPAYGNHLHIYNVSDGNLTTYKLDEDDSEPFVDRVSDAIIKDGYVYMLPMTNEGSLRRFNIETGSIEAVFEFSNEIRKSVSEEKKYLLTRAEVDSKGYLCFALWDTDIICSYDISRNKLSTLHCGVDHIFSVHIIDDKKYLLTNSNSSVYAIDNDGCLQEYIGNEKNLEKGVRQYNRVIKYGTEVMVLPAFGNALYSIREKTLVKVAELDLMEKKSPYICSFDVCEVNKELWILPFGTYNCLVLENDLSEKQRISFELVDECSKKIIQQNIFQYKMKKGIVCEMNKWKLDEFINGVVIRDEMKA